MTVNKDPYHQAAPSNCTIQAGTCYLTFTADSPDATPTAKTLETKRRYIMIKLRKIFSFPLLFLLAVFSYAAIGQDTYDDFGPQPQGAEKAAEQYAANQKKNADNNDVLVLPGLVANRQERRVDILIESTGVTSGDATEFLVVYTESSHGYEALFWSHAKPSDIHRALEFIGLRAGGASNPAALRFWSKGARINAYVQFGREEEALPLEKLVYDRYEERPLEESGFIFTGSMMVTAPDNSGRSVYAADQYDPYSIISAFNDPASVLDVGWQVSKQEAYKTYMANPELTAEGVEAHKLYMLILEPDAENGQSHIKNLTLKIEGRKTFILQDGESGKRLTPESTIDAALGVCREMIEAGKEPYVTLRFSNKMELGEIRPICAALGMLDQPTALRIEPPMEGRLYYRSFLPDESWREPANRRSQAWEIHLKRQEDKLTANMVFNEPIWKDGNTDPEYKKHSFSTPTGKAVRERLNKDAQARKNQNKRQLPPVLMVYAPADLNYGKLLDFLGPALETHNTVHIFLER